ncbi:hypothetical protein WA158_004903 [Blastocystis sp. Blastoise]
MEYNSTPNEKPIVALQLASDLFPANSQIKDHTSIPWGGILQPLNPDQEIARPKITQKEILRCKNCYGYISNYCIFEKDKYVVFFSVSLLYTSWLCPICNTYTPIDKMIAKKRYISAFSRAECDECVCNSYELEMPLNQDTKFSHVSSTASQLYVCIVDCTGDENYIKDIKTLLKETIKVIPNNMRFMLVTVGDRIGVYDLHSNYIRALVYYLRNINFYTQIVGFPESDAEGVLQCSDIPLFQIMDWEEATCMIESSRDQALRLVDAIQHQRGTCAIGSALHCVLDYIDIYTHKGLCIGGTMNIYISDAPSYGIGVLYRPYITPSSNSTMTPYLTPENNFYSDIGEKSRSLSFSLSLLYSTSTSPYIHLSSLLPMVTMTGGKLYGWNTNRGIQEIVSKLSHDAQEPLGTQVLFRFRSTSGISPSLMISSPQVQEHYLYKNIYQLAVLRRNTCIPFEFNYIDPIGIVIDDDARPHCQIAVEYTYTYIDKTINSNREVEYISRPVRRLRIINKPYNQTSAPLKIYNQTNPSICLYMLIHQLLPSKLSSGPEGLRSYLYQYLHSFYIQYARTNKVETGIYDVKLPDYNKLSIIPKYIYALLQKSCFYEYKNVDFFVDFLYSLTTYPPSVLSRYLYPTLEYYYDVDHVALSNCSLSWNSTSQCGHPLYVYYGLDKFIIFYSFDSEKENIPLPPPSNSQIMSYFEKCKRQYNAEYELELLIWKAGDHGNEFKSLLIEDAENQYVKIFRIFKMEEIDRAKAELQK